MLKRIAAALLLAPAADAALGSTATSVGPEGRGPTASGWMNKLPKLDAPIEEPAAEAIEDDAEAKASAAKAEADKKAAAAAKAKPDATVAKAKADEDALLAAAAEKDKKATAAKPDATPAADAAGDEYDIEKEAQPRTGDDWKKYKTKYSTRLKSLEQEKSEAMTEAATLQAKIAEIEQRQSAAPAANPEAEARLKHLEALNKQLSERIMQVDVEKEPRFETYFGEKYAAAHSDIKTILGDEAGKSYIDLLALPNSDYKKSQIAELYASLDDVQKSELGAVSTNLRAIEREKAQAIKEAKDSSASLKAEAASKADALRKQFETEFTKQLGSLQDPKNGFTAFQKRQGDDANTKKWNADVDSRIEFTKNYLLGKDMSPQTVVRAALDAASTPIYKALYNQQRAKWDEEKKHLEATIKELTAAQPAAGRGDGAEKDRTENPVFKSGIDPTTRSRNFAKHMADAMNGAGQ